MRHEINNWLREFQLHDDLHAHAVHVLGALPDDVLDDVMTEPGVVFYDYEPGPGVVMQVPVRLPRRTGSVSRSIVLKRTLCKRSPSFARWLIAHEVAHSFLRNAGRWPGDDPETAADALALQWGFPRPSMW